jgi:hypothetical protein
VNYLAETATAIRAELPADVLPDGDVHALMLIYAVLSRAKGPAVTAEDIHDAWAAWMSATDSQHPSIRPFSELSEDVKAQDEPFVEAVRRVGVRLLSHERGAA